MSGIGMSTYSTAAYSYALILYKENTQKGISRIQAALGIGPILSLVANSIIFKLFGYFVTFSVLAAALIVVSILITIFVEEIKDEKLQTETNLEIQQQKFKSWYIFSDFRVISGFFNVFLAMIIVNSPASLVSNRLDYYNLQEYLKLLTFLLVNVPFVIVSLLIHRFTKSTSLKKKFTCLGWVLL